MAMKGQKMPPRKVRIPRYVPVNVNRLYKAASDLAECYKNTMEKGAGYDLSQQQDPEYFALMELLEELKDGA